MPCPPGSETVYSPFKRLSQSEYFAYTGATDNSCWWQIICLLSSADEARKQQFAATSLVMGLVPLTLKDIAWPERRIVHVSRRLRRPIEVIVRALGVVPSIDASSLVESRTIASTSLYRNARRIPYNKAIFLVAISALGLTLSYAALAVVEIYSKRSCLGCPYPVFIVTWHLLAIIPALIDTAFSRPSESEKEGGIIDQQHGSTHATAEFPQGATGSDYQGTLPAPSKRQSQPIVELKQHTPVEDVSPVQGRGKVWLVQLVWAIYYIAGTLVYTSIVAVTVIELVVWVATSIATTAASKLLAFFICMATETKLGTM